MTGSSPRTRTVAGVLGRSSRSFRSITSICWNSSRSFTALCECLPDKRHFPESPRLMGGFAEARYFGWCTLSDPQTLPIKGHSLNAERILGSASLAAAFLGGPVLLGARRLWSSESRARGHRQRDILQYT